MGTFSGGDIVVQLVMDDGQFRPAVIRASDVTKTFRREIEAAGNAVQKTESHFDSVGRKFRDTIMTLGALRFAFMDVNDIFLKLPMSMLKTAGELEKMQQLMVGLSKESDKTKAALEGIRGFDFVVGMAKNAPFDIQSLSDSFVKLKVASIDPANGSMKALVDSVARFGGTGETLKRASVAIQQMAGKGVISMEELRQQLGEAVPTAMKAMADGMGMTVAELTEKVSKGMVKAGPALQKMFLRMQIDNEGAAADMMNTWVGMTARLKTEWDLAAKHVVDSGLGAAAKQVVSELSTILQSEEFRGFASDFGSGLGEVTKDALAVSKALVGMREEIGLVVKVWLAYKLATSVIAPVAKGISDAMNGIGSAVRNASNDLIKSERDHRSLALSMVQNARYSSEARAAELAEKLSSDQKELASVRARNAAILAEDARLAAQLKALRAAEASRNVNNYGEQQRVLRAMDELSRKNTELLARQSELQKSIPLTTVALGNAREAAASKTKELARLTTGMDMAKAATIATTAATKAFGAMSSFLGGPIGVLITSIGLLAAAWQHVKSKADEARAAQERAASRTSIEGDDELLKAQLQKAKIEVERAEERASQDRVIKGGGASGYRNKTLREVEADLTALNDAKERYKKAEENIARARETVQESAAKRRADNFVAEVTRTTELQNQETRRQIAAIRQQKDDLENSTKSDKEKASPEFKAKIQKLMDEQTSVLVSGYDKRISIISAKVKELRDAEKGTPGSDKARLVELKAAADALEKERDRIEGEREGLMSRISVKPEFGGGKTKAEKESKFQIELERLTAEKRQLDAIFDGFSSSVGKADKVAGEIAKVEQQIANGNFGKLTAAESKKLVDLVAAIADRRKAIKDAEQAAEEAARVEAKRVKDVERVTEYIAGMQPEIERAAEILMDPLGATEAKAPKETSTKKWIAKNKKELQEYVDELVLSGKDITATFETVSRSMISGAQGIDAANFFAGIAKETASLNKELVDDTRASAQARAEAEDRRHFRVMQSIIDERKAKGESTKDIEEMVAIMNQNILARTRETAEKFKSPLEKLAQEWGNVTKQMENATERWATGFMDSIVESVATGKLQFSSFVESVLKDLLRIQMQKMFSPVVTSGVDSLTSFVGNMFGISSVKTPSVGVGGDMSSVGFDYFFADGGVMTEFGTLPLHKYARGGIATRPQAAIFGEGSMPEAYVPLPDGRTIPVTMSGKGGPTIESIQVNVINQSGQPVESSKKDVSTSFDGKKIVLDIVLEAVSQPGRFRDGFKGALMR